ncbi:MAG: hypothetical protein JRJ58_01695 [Deltaproteobacteria bacterium]|nr:hypothetical protein [Deltaproteobacteria bacterium]
MSLPSVEFSSPFGQSNWVELLDARVIEGATPALAVTVANLKKKPVWVRVEVEEIDGGNSCMNSFKLDPGTSHRYACRQTSISVGNRYRAELVVYKDQGNTQVSERIRRLIVVRRSESGALELDGRPAD